MFLRVIGRHPSSDPIPSVAGGGTDAAALLHNHIDVGLHDLGDLSNLSQSETLFRQKNIITAVIQSQEISVILFIIAYNLNQFIAFIQQNKAKKP